MQALLAKPGGGRQWLYSLRDIPYREASEALCELPGIGPKVRMHVSLVVWCVSASVHYQLSIAFAAFAGFGSF